MTQKNTNVRWQAIVARYAIPDRWRSTWQIVNSVLPFLAMWYVMYRSLEISYWLTLFLAIPTAGFMVRTFIIFHDCGHGSFFKSSKANDTLGIITGILTLTVQYWAGPTHTWGGTNWAAAFLVTTVMLGLGQLLGGIALLVLREKAERMASRPEVRV